MLDVLRKRIPREKYVKDQNFPTLFRLSLSLECSGEISRQSAESAYPINSVKVDVFLSKSYARFSLVIVEEQISKRGPKKWLMQYPHHTKGLTTDSDSEIPTDNLFNIPIYKLWGQ